VIRKITPAGVVTTFAGAYGSPGTTNASTPLAARFTAAQGMAMDSAGNLYVAEWDRCDVRKITPAGVVTTLAGSGVIGSADGTGTAASFSNFFGIAVDPSGNVYVADRGNHTIRKITPAGVVTTLAGTAGQSGTANGLGAAARFNGPDGIVYAPNGNLYLTESASRQIRMITLSGMVSTAAGTGLSGTADGAASVATFNYPFGITSDTEGNLIVGDFTNHTIRRLTFSGVVSTIGGAAGVFASTDGVGTAARFSSPRDVAFDSAGAVYVTDFYNSTSSCAVPEVP
jgi:sugar lactone lactonase YvrE